MYRNKRKAISHTGLIDLKNAMMIPFNNWVRHPSKKQCILSIIAWFAGMLFLLLSLSNFFTETVFQGKYLMVGFVVLASTLLVIVICRNYCKSGSNRINQ